MPTSSRICRDSSHNCYSRWVFWAISLIHATLLTWAAVVNSPTTDEVAHVPAGLMHWRTGTFSLYKVNPPLMRMIVTIPLLAASPATNWDHATTNDPYARPEFQVGVDFLNSNASRAFWLFTICRFMQIPVSIFGAWMCYRWATELFGHKAALITLLVWCFCPNMITWGSTVTPDLGAAVFGVSAGYAFWHWLKASTWNRTFLAGVGLGIASLSRTTWLILFVVWPLMWLCWQSIADRSSGLKVAAAQLACLLGLGLYIINVGYAFENSFQSLGRFSFVSQMLGGSEAHRIPGNRFRETILASVPVPVPASYLEGIDIQKSDFERTKPSYLRGQHRNGGWYSYYLYGLVIKTPLGYVVLILIAACGSIFRCGAPCKDADRFALLFPAISMFVLVSSQNGFSRHVRYALPVLPFLYILAGSSAHVMLRGGKLLFRSYVLCVVVSVCSSLCVYPHSMSYFSSIVGGPLGGPAHLLDSNIDWGQDLLRLRSIVRAHPEISEVHVSYSGLVAPTLGMQRNEAVRYSPLIGRPVVFSAGWYAISVNHLHDYPYDTYSPSKLHRLRRISPDMMAGYSMYIYCVDDDEVRLLQNED